MAELHSDQRTKVGTFGVAVGLRLGFILLALLFIIYMEWMLRCNRGRDFQIFYQIRDLQLRDLAYADDHAQLGSTQFELPGRGEFNAVCE